MNALDAELALDRLEARLAAELPAHIAASAHAYADNTPSPAAIEIARRDVSAVLAARWFDELRARCTRVLRVIAPIVIESAPRVVAARALERTWANWRTLAVAREDESQRAFGVSYRALVHALAGVSRQKGELNSEEREAVSEEWTRDTREGDGPLQDDVADADIRAVWSTMTQGETVGALSIVRSASAHPRTFVVERGVRAIIVVPERIDTSAARFAVLHELGHALLWLAPISREHEWPRAIDEAAASYVARLMELDGANGANDVTSAKAGIHRWGSAQATAARKRRLAIARVLDAIEGGAERGAIERPPWALWNDPHAQAAYVTAEQVADALPVGLHGCALADHLAKRASAIDAEAIPPN